jgi:hypothetical protein
VVATLPETARGRPGKDGLEITSPAATIPEADDIAAFLELSDERDQWLRRLRAEYERGFADGRACACVALAEMEQRRESVEHCREWAATLRRIIQNDADPSSRMNQVMAEIAADQKFMRDARAKLSTKPWTLSPLESCALRRIRLADPGDAV